MCNLNQPQRFVLIPQSVLLENGGSLASVVCDHALLMHLSTFPCRHGHILAGRSSGHLDQKPLRQIKHPTALYGHGRELPDLAQEGPTAGVAQYLLRNGSM